MSHLTVRKRMKESRAFELQLPPSFSDAQIEECRNDDNLLPIFFEIQKATLVAVITCAQLRYAALHYVIHLNAVERI